MTDRLCEICSELNDINVYVLELKDDKEKVQFEGHRECIDELHIKVKSIKDLAKKPIYKVLKEIGLNKQ